MPETVTSAQNPFALSLKKLNEKKNQFVKIALKRRKNLRKTNLRVKREALRKKRPTDSNAP